MEKLNLIQAIREKNGELDDKQTKFVTAFEDALNKRFTSEKEEYADEIRSALNSVLGELPKDEDGKVETIASQIRSIATQMEKIEENRMGKMSEMEKFQLRGMLEKNKEDIIQAIRSGGQFDLSFNARVAAPQLNSNTYSDAGAFIMPDVENYLQESGIARIRYPENFILNVISNAQVSKVPEQVIRTEQDTEEGTVGVVAEGGTKPLVSFTFVRSTTSREKYAARLEWSEEFEMDNEMLFAEILRLFEEKVIREWQDGLLTTIETNAVAYTSSVLDGTFVTPDNALAAIAAQSVIDNMNYTANTVVMNPSDVVATLFTQNTEGDPRILPYITNGTINGMRLISSNKIAQGNALVGDMTVYREWHSPFITRFGRYNDQLITNESTVIGEVFSLMRIAVIDLPAVMYIDLDAVKTSLTVVP